MKIELTLNPQYKGLIYELLLERTKVGKYLNPKNAEHLKVADWLAGHKKWK